MSKRANEDENSTAIEGVGSDVKRFKYDIENLCVVESPIDNMNAELRSKYHELIGKLYDFDRFRNRKIDDDGDERCKWDILAQYVSANLREFSQISTSFVQFMYELETLIRNGDIENLEIVYSMLTGNKEKFCPPLDTDDLEQLFVSSSADLLRQRKYYNMAKCVEFIMRLFGDKIDTIEMMEPSGLTGSLMNKHVKADVRTIQLKRPLLLEFEPSILDQTTYYNLSSSDATKLLDNILNFITLNNDGGEVENLRECIYSQVSISRMKNENTLILSPKMSTTQQQKKNITMKKGFAIINNIGIYIGKEKFSLKLYTSQMILISE